MPTPLVTRIIKLFSLLISAAFIAAASQAHEHSNNTHLNQKADQNFEQISAFVHKAMAEKAVPGVAIGVLQNGQHRTAAFGITNIDNPQLVTEKTLFQIGSITKTMTGTIMMRLAEQGKLDLDANVRQYLPHFKVKDEQVSADVKVRDLLTHMSGWVGDHFSTKAGAGDDALSRILAEMTELEQLAPLNSVYSYNNSAFYVAAHIIEVITKDTIQNVMQSMIFDDIGMHDSYIVPSDVMTKPYVVGHNNAAKGISVAQRWALYRAAWAAGGGIMTAGDMLKYAAFHLGDGTNSDGEQVMQPASLLAMQATQAPKVGTEDAIGITWHLSSVGNLKVVTHGGATNGQQAYLLLIPEKDFAITVLTNAGNGRALHREVIAFALEQYFDAKNPEPILQTRTQQELVEYVGLYSRPFRDLKITVVDGQLMIQAIPKQSFLGNEIAPPSPLRAFSFFETDRIVDKSGNFKAEFIRNEDGSIGWIRSSRIFVKQ